MTREIREHGQRVGFEAIGLGGRSCHPRSRPVSARPVSVGRYGVEPDRLVPLIEEELDRPPGTVDAYLIDEIGKMECHCPQFIAAMSRLLEDRFHSWRPSLFAAAVSSPRSRNALTCRLVEVTHANRQTLPAQIAAWVNQHTAQANTP